MPCRHVCDCIAGIGDPDSAWHDLLAAPWNSRVSTPLDYTSTNFLRARDRIVLTGFLFAILLPGTIDVSLFDRDEGWYAQTTREMVASGDWIIPRYLGESRYYKPPLMFWCSGLSVLALGRSEFALRLPGVVATVAAMLVLAEFAARHWGRGAGYWSAAVAGSSLGPNLAGGLMLPEGYLLLFLTLAMICWMQKLGAASADGTVRRTKAYSYGFWVASALACLAKGPAMLVVIVPCFLAFLWTEPPRGSTIAQRVRHVWPGPGWYVGLLIGAPWYIAVACLDWAAFKSDFIDYHTVSRLREPIEGHRGFPGYYIVTGLILLWPWAALMPGAIANAWRVRRDDAITRRLLVWLVVPWLAFEFISTKLPYYVLPLLPPMAMLTGRELARVTTVGSMRLRFEPTAYRVWLGGIAFAGAAFVGVAIRFSQAPPAFALGAAGAVLLLTAVICSFFRMATPWRARAGILVASMVIFYQIIGWWAVPKAEPLRLSRRIADHVNATAHENDIVLADGFAEPSMFYYLDREGRELTVKNGRIREAGESFILVADERKLDPLQDVLTIDRASGRMIEGFNYVRGRHVRVWVGRARSNVSLE